MKYLDELETRIQTDVEDYRDNMSLYKLERNSALNNLKQKGGLKVTRKMILEAAMSDTVDEITTILLRDKKISIFDDNYEETDGTRFKLEELCRVECIFASHNLIKDVMGIS